MEEINDFLTKKLLSNKEINKNDLPAFNDYIERNVNGIIAPDILYDYLVKSINNSFLRYTWPVILCHCDKRSVTDKVFNLIRRYPRVTLRKTLLISIAHSPISVYQLQYICNKKICVEAFAQLLDIYITNDCFSLFDVQDLVVKNTRFICGIDLKLIEKDFSSNNEKVRYLIDFYAKFGM